MNILRVSTFPTQEKSGMGLHPYHLCNIEGAYTYFLAPKNDGKRKDIPPNTQLIEKYFWQEVRPRTSGKIAGILFQIKRIISILLFSFYGIRILITKKIDIVHIHSPMYSLIAIFGKLIGKKIYITFHGTDFYRIKNSKIYLMFSSIYQGVFAISPDMISDLQKIHGARKVKQVENGIDRNVYINKLGIRDKKIIAVGALKEEKGFDVLIDAFLKFINSSANAEKYDLTIVGEGLLRGVLQSQISALNLSEKVHLIGHKNQKDVVELYNSSEIFVLSSISEGFPKVLLEAISCGCKIVSTNVGSVPEILSNYKYITQVSNSEDLADKISSISQLEYLNITKYYIETLNRYSWDKVKKDYVIYYKELL